MPRCCIVMPAYREAENLPIVLPAVFAQQPKAWPCELFVLVVDDDNLDSTRALLADLRQRFPLLRTIEGQKQGLGVAYQRGFAYALDTMQADLVMQMDADGQHDPAAVPELIHACKTPVAAVVGSRFAPGGETPAFSARRRRMSLAGNAMIHRCAGLPPLDDYTSGFRCFQATVLRQALEHCRGTQRAARGYAFQSSLIAEVLLSGAPVVEAPICFGAREHGESKLTGRDCWEFLLNVGHLRARRQAWRKQRRAAAAAG